MLPKIVSFFLSLAGLLVHDRKVESFIFSVKREFLKLDRTRDGTSINRLFLNSDGRIPTLQTPNILGSGLCPVSRTHYMSYVNIICSREVTKVGATGFSKETDIYSDPSLYDLAFGYRDFEAELDFLTYAHEKYSPSKQEPKRILELAAGPARHSLTALTGEGFDNYSHATAVDLSRAMKKYSLDLAKTEYIQQAKDNGRETFEIINDKELPSDGVPNFQYVLCDMKSVHESKGITPHSFDTAWILLGSLQHLNTNPEVIQCFKSLHECLSDEGTVVIELPHPQEQFAMTECTKNTWEVPLELSNESSAKLTVVWGDETDKFDPITQIRDFSVKFDLVVEGNNERKSNDKRMKGRSINQIVPTRIFTAQEMQLLAKCGGFEVAAMYGALDPEVSIFDYEEELAYRMVCVLRKQRNRSEKEEAARRNIDKSS